MSTNPDAFKIQTELSEVIRLHNQTLERLRAFQSERPYAVAPNILKMAEENLKENVAILYKQWNEVHKPPGERVRHVCQQCNYVFASALPGGICDECRSKGGTNQPAAYGAWPVTPESEAATQSDATPLPSDVVEKEAFEEIAEEDKFEETEAESEQIAPDYISNDVVEQKDGNAEVPEVAFNAELSEEAEKSSAESTAGDKADN